jgi:hypothetical protein
MAALAWLVAPRLAHTLTGPTALTQALIAALTAEIVWQNVLVLILVHLERGSLRRTVTKDARWLHRPRHPCSGPRGGKTRLVVVPTDACLGSRRTATRPPRHPPRPPSGRQARFTVQSATLVAVILSPAASGA